MAKSVKSEKAGGYIVKSAFRNINDFNIVHEVGDDVSDFEAERLKVLEDAGLVEKVDAKAVKED